MIALSDRTATGPWVSVIVPVFNDWEAVKGLVRRLAAQTMPSAAFEVLLVDNGSDHVPALDLPSNFKMLFCSTPGSYAARNHGVSAAVGTWLAFTDADCLPDAEWLEKIAAACSRRDVRSSVLAGAVEMVGTSAKPGTSEIYDLVKGIPQERYVGRGYGVTANLAVSAATFREAGGFDPSRFSGGDADFCRRAGRLGHGIVYLADARVGHRPRRTWEEVSTKARRIKGGQISAGSRKSRAAHAIRTVLPPVRGAWLFLNKRAFPARFRLIATAVLFRIWLVEMAEMIRLVSGSPAERR